MERLQPEMIQEILIRVPTKSLARCKSVCKPWNAIIKYPTFLKSQFALVASGDTKREEEFDFLVARHEIRTFTILFNDMYLLGNKYNHDEQCESFELLREIDMLKEVYVKGCVKGFLCLCTKSGSGSPKGLDEDYANYIYNPVTQECVELPEISFGGGKEVEVDTGFGFVDCSNEFKVVVIVSWENGAGNRQREVKVHTVGSKCWRIVECLFPFKSITNEGAEFLNGSVHWPCRINVEPGEPFVVAFDLKSEEFRVVPVPDDLVENRYENIYIGVLDGCLYVGGRSSDRCIEIWSMRRYNVKESWTKLISVKDYDFTVLASFCVMKPLISKENGEIVLIYNYKYICSYNPEDGYYRTLNYSRRQVVDNDSEWDLQICPYTASSFHLSQYAEWRGNVDK